MNLFASAQEVKDSFSGDNLESNLIPIEVTRSYVQNNDILYVNKATGICSAKLPININEVVQYWSNNIFKSSSPEDYNAFLPFATARLFYVFRSIIDFFKLTTDSKLTIADFATGQGVLLNIIKNFSKNLNLVGTEHSGDLVEMLSNSGFNIQSTPVTSKMPSLFEADIGIINWTLSCCADPYDFLLGVRNNLSDSGYVVVAESSRIMVPYKKPLSYLLNPTHPTNIHPFYFSKNSLAALLQSCGFEVRYTNRFFDSDVLLIIAQKSSMPNQDKKLVVDSAEDVINFFNKYHELTNFYQTLEKNN
jgi:hypothetical protein